MLLVVPAVRPDLTQWFPWPAPVHSHRDATVDTPGLSQGTQDLSGSTNARAQEDSGSEERPALKRPHPPCPWLQGSSSCDDNQAAEGQRLLSQQDAASGSHGQLLHVSAGILGP